MMEDAYNCPSKGLSGLVQLFPQLTQEELFSLLLLSQLSQLLLFGGDKHDSKLWKPFPLVVACSLEELPVKPLCVEQEGHRIIFVTCGNATTPHLQCWVLFHSSKQCFPHSVSKRKQKYSNNKDILAL